MTVKFHVQNSSPGLFLLKHAPPLRAHLSQAGLLTRGQVFQGGGQGTRLQRGPGRPSGLPSPHTCTTHTLSPAAANDSYCMTCPQPPMGWKVRGSIPASRRRRLREACDYRIARGSSSGRRLALASGSLAAARGRRARPLRWPGPPQRCGQPCQLHPDGACRIGSLRKAQKKLQSLY